MIMCGGKGTRLKSMTKNIPKPLVEVNKKPILDYILDYCKNEYPSAKIYKTHKLSKLNVEIKNPFHYA